MSPYAHIQNLYRPEAQAILLMRECFCMEKIHGTSATVAWHDGGVHLSPGGVSAAAFATLFELEALEAQFRALGHERVVVYGEAYGGKCQGMSATYGPQLRFIAFEVQIGDVWLNVPNADEVARKLGIEFVHYERCSTDIAILDWQRDAESAQAVRNGMGPGHMREGIVIRPLVELTTSNGQRVMAKHKRPEFSERVTPQEVDPAKRKVLEDAEAIAAEYVTDMRLNHVLDRLGNPHDMTAIPQIIAAMVEDVTREASGEIVDNKAVRKAIGARAVKLFKARLQGAIA